MNIYVDAKNGNDKYEGTITRPFATLDVAFSCIPEMYKDAIHIYLAPGEYNTSSFSIENKYIEFNQPISKYDNVPLPLPG